jgi:tetratricopeptide (TPR) repeat protein
MLADAATRQHDLAALQQYVPLAEEIAQRYGHILYQAIAHRAWGVAYRLAGEYAEAEARLKQALQLFESLETRWQIGRTLFELGELALSEENVPAAHDHFSRALVAFEAMQATPDAAQVRVKMELLTRYQK